MTDTPENEQPQPHPETQPEAPTEPQFEPEKKPAAKRKPAAKKPAGPTAKEKAEAAKKQNALKGLVKLAKDALPDPSKAHELTWYPTGCTIFDAVMANGHPGVVGGFPAGRMIELYGAESTGKTTLALQAAARLQQQGKLVVYFDYERSFHEEYAQSLGLDTTPFCDEQGNLLGGLFWLLEPDYMESGWTLMEELCENEGTKDIIGMFIVDSVAAQTSMHSKDDKEEHDRRGLVASQMARFLPDFARALKQTEATCIFINQTRQNMDSSPFADPETTPGGKALKFYCSIRIGLGRGYKISTPLFDPLKGEKERSAIGHWVRVKIKKNKASGEYYKEFQLPIVDNLGVDNVLSCIELAKALKLVGTSGAWLSVPAAVAGSVDDVSGNGPFGLRAQLVAVPEIRDRFVANVTQHLAANFARLHEARQGGRAINDATDEDQLDGNGVEV